MTQKKNAAQQKNNETEDVCYYCKQPNHFAKHCRKQLKDLQQTQLMKQENQADIEEQELNQPNPV